MKKRISLFILVVMLLVLVACNDDVHVPTAPMATQGTLPTQTENVNPPSAPADPTESIGQQTEPPHTHSWQDATCTAPKTCTACGATEGEAMGHVWQDATCTVPKTCKVCNTTDGQPKDHSWDEGKVTVEATEETVGEKLHTCTACGETKTAIIPELGHTHDYEAVVTSPTCTETGYTKRTCRCGDSYITDEVAASGHDWQEATCTTPKTCKTCGVTEGTAKGHEWQEATCTEPKTCETCCATEGTAKGHDWQDATCTAPKTCRTCGATEGTAKGHEWQDATCTEPKTCKTCGTTEGAAKGHEWQDATCTAPKTCKTCGATEGAAKGHDWEEATCATPKTCKTCGATEGKAKGHDWKEATCKEPATCTVCGEVSGTVADHAWQAATCTTPATCSYCGITSGAPAGHSWESATCTKPKSCSRCDAQEGEPLDHDWCFVACESWMQCSRCSQFGGEYVHHDWDEHYICKICYYPQCEEYGHYYFYNRCYYCHSYDEESTAMAEALLPNIVTSSMSEYEKVKAIHDYIINNTRYDYDNYLNGTVPDSSFSAVGVLQYGVAVCQGYAYAFELLCDLAGIECELVTGTAGGGGHAWNQVKVDGEWYNIDLTWDDPVYFLNGVLTPILVYDYFLISDGQMYLDHIANDAQHTCDESYPMP